MKLLRIFAAILFVAAALSCTRNNVSALYSEILPDENCTYVSENGESDDPNPEIESYTYAEDPEYVTAEDVVKREKVVTIECLLHQ